MRRLMSFNEISFFGQVKNWVKKSADEISVSAESDVNLVMKLYWNFLINDKRKLRRATLFKLQQLFCFSCVNAAHTSSTTK